MEPITKKCKDCGEDFEITPRDQEFLAAQVNKDGTKGWPLYVRCLKCRRAKRDNHSGGRPQHEPQLPPRPPKRV